jgi:hypothetical protein
MALALGGAGASIALTARNVEQLINVKKQFRMPAVEQKSSASKTALLGLTRALALELAADGITVMPSVPVRSRPR